MHSTFNLDKCAYVFKLRRHKLYKAIIFYHQNASAWHPESEFDQTAQLSPSFSKKSIIELLQILSKANVKSSDVSYFIENQFECEIEKYIDFILQDFKVIIEFIPGRLIAFTIYRLCLKFPQIFEKIKSFIKELEDQAKSFQILVLIVDLYVYGFTYQHSALISKILPRFQSNVLKFIPIYGTVFKQNEFFSIKTQRKVEEMQKKWLENEYEKLKIICESLNAAGTKIQMDIVEESDNDEIINNYIAQCELFEKVYYKLSLLIDLIDGEDKLKTLKIKSFYDLKKQCNGFKKNFELQQFQNQLYHQHKIKKESSSMKKCQIAKLQQNLSFINQIKQCNKLQNSLIYSQYFIDQMNSIKNREEFVEIIINECHSYNNLAYIIKILDQIAQVQPQIKDYCEMKSIKITSQIKMNRKYQNVLCQFTKFGLISASILLSYAERILIADPLLLVGNAKEICDILENLGPIIFYQSIEMHIRMNKLIQQLEITIKNHMNQFNLEHLFQLKCISTFLQNPTKINQLPIIQKDEISEIELKTNFTFIKRKCEKILKEGNKDRVIQYLVESINQNDFISSYYYASLVKQLNNVAIDQIIYQNTIQIITKNIQNGYNIQKSVNWSRFLGQLYNYEIINRKKLIKTLHEMIKRFELTDEFEGILKCIASALEISKEILFESEERSINKDVLKFLIYIKKLLIQRKSLQNRLIQDEITEIMQFFDPVILTHLTDIRIIDKVEEHYSRLPNKHIFLIDVIESLSNGESQISPDKSRISYTQKKESQKKIMYKQKSVKYIEKTEANNLQKQKSEIKERDIISVTTNAATNEEEAELNRLIQEIGNGITFKQSQSAFDPTSIKKIKIITKNKIATVPIVNAKSSKQ